MHGHIQIHIFIYTHCYHTYTKALRHARECLDTLAFSLLSYLHLDEVCNSNDDAVLRETICHTSDKYMLSVQFGIMYNKIFRCTLRRVDNHVRKIRNNTTTTTIDSTTKNTTKNDTIYHGDDSTTSPTNSTAITINNTNNSNTTGTSTDNDDNSNNVYGATSIVSRAFPSNVSICEDVLSTVNELSIALVESKLVIDKLNILVKILQTLSAVRSTPIIPMQSSMESSTINNSNSCADKKEDENSATTYYSATNSSTINMENPTNEDEARSSVPTIMKSSGSASTDTDELLESLCNVIQWSMATNDDDDDDDERVQINDNDRASSTASSTISKSTKTRDTFLISNSNNKKYTSNIHWLAEFAYMSCSVLLRDLDSVSIGPQGYALVTLQQCMHILYGIDIFDIDVSRKEPDPN